MSKNVRTPDSCIREFIKSEFVGSKEYTRQKCEWSLQRTRRLLEAAGFDASPYKIDAKAIEFLLYEGWKDHEVSYRKSEFSYLKRYLLFYRNDTPKRMKVVFPQDMRVNADWLEDEEYDALMNIPKTPLEDIVIHLELCMGLRNVEVCRLMLNDIHNTGTKPYINVRGKGRGDGKYRSVRFHYMTKDVLARWMEERASIVQTVRSYNPYWQDPGTLILWCHYKHSPMQGRMRSTPGPSTTRSSSPSASAWDSTSPTTPSGGPSAAASSMRRSRWRLYPSSSDTSPQLRP